MRSIQDTIAAIATPLGESGIGVIRLSGSSAIEVAKSIFRPAKSIDLADVPSHTCYFGVIITNDANLEQGWMRNGSLSDKKPIDQVVVTVFRAPHSYTGEDVVEISAHGSPFILQQILQTCFREGARSAEPGEFTQRAFVAGKMDLTQAEAVSDLIRAKTDQAHSAAMSQLTGHLASRVQALRDALLPLLAHVEVGLDHSDEDHSFLSRDSLLTQCKGIQLDLEGLLASGKVGKILREGLKVALVGRPNVGKSSLMNALLKEDRAIVTPLPGTTRDTLEESLNWEGIPVVLTDTAGVRRGSSDAVERLGMERTRQTLHEADVVLCVLDASAPLEDEDRSLIRECVSKPHIWVVNKIDLPARWNKHHLDGLNGHSPAVTISAKTGAGLENLVEAVKLLTGTGQTSAGEARWMINQRHQGALIRARDALAHASQAAQSDSFEECVALELHTALQALGEIVGETAADDLLDQIFSNFCIGK